MRRRLIRLFLICVAAGRHIRALFLFAGITRWMAAVILFGINVSSLSAGYVHTNLVPPTLEREFRGAWVATLNNIDWPSRPGLPVEEQKRELLRILERAVQLRLNALLFQVRPACDAFYESR